MSLVPKRKFITVTNCMKPITKDNLIIKRNGL